MHTQCMRRVSRREFLGGLTLMGTAGVLGLHTRPEAAEAPPETTKIRLIQVPGICVAPQYIAEELLKGEGFTDVQYLKVSTADVYKVIASGEVDISMAFIAPFILQVDKSIPIVLLGGVHVGCFELFGTDKVRAVSDLKGKTVAIPELGSSHHVFLSIIAAHAGLDPQKDINWVTHPIAESLPLLTEGVFCLGHRGSGAGYASSAQALCPGTWGEPRRLGVPHGDAGADPAGGTALWHLLQKDAPRRRGPHLPDLPHRPQRHPARPVPGDALRP
jgi:NMT1/THI5 like